MSTPEELNAMQALFSSIPMGNAGERPYAGAPYKVIGPNGETELPSGSLTWPAIENKQPLPPIDPRKQFDPDEFYSHFPGARSSNAILDMYYRRFGRSVTGEPFSGQPYQNNIDAVPGIPLPNRDPRGSHFNERLPKGRLDADKQMEIPPEAFGMLRALQQGQPMQDPRQIMKDTIVRPTFQPAFGVDKQEWGI